MNAANKQYLDAHRELYGRSPYREELTSRKLAYSQYLKSHSWKALSQSARERARFKCEICRGPGPIQVHHFKYPKNLKDDCLQNLIVACETCHKKLHGYKWIFASECIFSWMKGSEEEIAMKKEEFSRLANSRIEFIKNCQPVL